MRKALSHWRSTLAGIAMILSAVTQIHSLADLSNAKILGELAGGVGLIASADAKKEKES